MSAKIEVKSRAGNKKAYLWIMQDFDGVLKAVCYEARNLDDLRSNGFLATAVNQAKSTFRKADGPSSPIIQL